MSTPRARQAVALTRARVHLDRLLEDTIPGSIIHTHAEGARKAVIDAAKIAKGEGFQTIKVRVEQRPDTPLGIPSGLTMWHVWVVDSGGHPFSGCPLGRSTGGERPAIRDLIRPGYSLPMETDVTLDDIEVIERRELVKGGEWVTR
jgi:hypothetical protein